MKRALIIFEKNKIPGKVKTRLAAKIGDEAALILYGEMTSYIHEIVKTDQQDNYIYYSDFLEDKSSPDFYYSVQFGSDLGERMLNAFLDLKIKKYDQVLIIGTDCIELKSEDFQKAFSILDNKDIVIGPAEDGGYYLLGLNHIYPELFENMEWSNESVFTETLKRATQLDLSIGFLPTLNDIDDLEDLEKSKLSKR